MYSEIVQSPRFYFDSDGLFIPEATSFLMIGSELDILITYLNSSIVSWIFKHYYAGGGLGNGFRYKKAFIEKLPVPNQKITSKDESIIESSILKAYKLTEKEGEYINSNL